jgi:ATP-binding cassette subfamily B protein
LGLTPGPETGLQCLVAVARHHGIDLSADALAHAYGAGSTPIGCRLMLRIAQDAGLRGRRVVLTWARLLEHGRSLPALGRLTNGNWVILVGVAADGTKRIVVLDPLADRPEPLYLAEADLCPAWSGETILFRTSRARAKAARGAFGLSWFGPEILRQRRLFGDVIVAAIALYALALAVPMFSQLVIDKVLMHESYATLGVLAAGVAIAIVFEAIFTFLRRYLMLYASNRIDIRVAVRTFAHLLSLPLPYFETIPAGVLVKHMQQGARIREFLTGRLFTAVLDGLSLVVFVPVLLLYSVKLSLVVLGFTLLVALVIGLLVGPFRRRLLALYEAEGERQAQLVEAVHGMRTIKALAIEPLHRTAWDDASAETVMMRYGVERISAIAQSATGLLEKLMTIAVIALGAVLVFNHEMSVGALVAFNMLAGRVSGPLVQILTMIHEFQEVGLAVKMLGSVMNETSEERGDRRGLCPSLEGGIVFENVSFTYASDRSPALDDVSFEIRPGSIVGIVGRSGSGKTTITRLVQRLYPLQSGIVRIDGYDIREIDLAHLRRSLGVVLQDNFLFRGTVRDNIAAAAPAASMEAIAASASAAGATEFIERLPRGFDTVLEENAENLSGGQKQRLAIARALLVDPKILILDEATSALDPDSEAIIRQNLRRIAEGRTVLIVSHRLASLIGADVILVVDHGRVIAAGPHEALLGGCTVYRHLWNQQTRQAA